MSEETTIQVNFGRPMPIFPLNTVALLPHTVLPLNVFEERYRQMVADALDGAGQIAMAVFEGDRWMQEYHGRPPIRPAVCVGQIIQHHKFPDGRYLIALQGVCRARITYELPPSVDVLYRRAMLEPVGIGDTEEEEDRLTEHREHLSAMLATPPLTDLRDSPEILMALSEQEVPTAAILELLTLRYMPDQRFRYNMLQEGDPVARAKMVETEMGRLRHLLEAAAPQRAVDWPKGMSWN